MLEQVGVGRSATEPLRIDPPGSAIQTDLFEVVTCDIILAITTTFPSAAAAAAMANHGGTQMHHSGQLRRYDDSARCARARAETLRAPAARCSQPRVQPIARPESLLLAQARRGRAPAWHRYLKLT